MKSVIRVFFYTLLFVSAGLMNSFAVNAVDSDLSNTAGSNSGHINVSPFILVVVFLVLAATAPFYTKRKRDL